MSINDTIHSVRGFMILEVPDGSAGSAKIMYPDRFIVPRCYIEQILNEAADRACAIWLDQDCVFQSEIDHFRAHIEARLRKAITADGFPGTTSP